MFPFIFDWTFIILIPSMLLALWAQAKVKGNLTKYSKVPTRRGMTGAQVAAQLLAEHGLRDVALERLPDNKPWADHYDPKARAVRLSAHVYDSTSISAVSVAVHEVGHAVQHSESYFPLAFRSGMFPIVRFGSGAAIPIIFIGIILGALGSVDAEIVRIILNVGIIMFTAVVLFQLITLPVEFNASRRAMVMMEQGRYLSDDTEIRGARKVLSAAAMTYVAAATAAISQLIRLLIITSRHR